MKPFSLYRIILLLFVFGFNNLYAVQSATTDPTKTETVATISKTKIVKDTPRKSKRKSKLIAKFKEKFASFFPKDNTQENTAKNENLETRTHGLAIASLVCGILGFFTAGILSILAIIFGGVSLQKINTSGGFYTGRGMAIAGLVLGIIVVSIFLIILSINTF